MSSETPKNLAEQYCDHYKIIPEEGLVLYLTTDPNFLHVCEYLYTNGSWVKTCDDLTYENT
jgi:hypothetical protein